MLVCEIDHMVITAPSLEDGAEYVRRSLGVTPQPGGQHPDMGTHNRLVKLGETAYLEIIAADPAAPKPDRPRPQSAPAAFLVTGAWLTNAPGERPGTRQPGNPVESEMRFHLRGLGKKQITVLRDAGRRLQKRGFYLGGGSALAAYLEHRLSVDLNWFTATSMGDALVLAESLRCAGVDFVTEQTASGTLHGVIMGVRVTFLEFRYPLLGPLTGWKEMGCSLASLDDLACMKLSAAAQRGQRKDFCDIYALGTKHCSLKVMLALYQQKFKIKDISPILYSLSYFDDAEREPMPRMLW